ncbi:MAG: hypothetical protein KUG77_26260 [Nannocystaceae bacterium]|nr:hypothetical protein [Nannocystaceae bacterium]
MPLPIRPEAARIIEDYLRAKDAQIPQLYRRVFTEDALFVPSYAMPSPFGDDTPRCGIADITTAFRAMGQQCENILTVVPVESIREDAYTITSQWVVAMTRRDGGDAFVGWGTYRWTLGPAGTRARKLAVRFEGLCAPKNVAETFEAMLELSHPWCTQDALLDFAQRAHLDALQDWLRITDATAQQGAIRSTTRVPR